MLVISKFEIAKLHVWRISGPTDTNSRCGFSRWYSKPSGSKRFNFEKMWNESCSRSDDTWTIWTNQKGLRMTIITGKDQIITMTLLSSYQPIVNKTPPLKENSKSGFYCFQILRIKKWKRGFIVFKIFAALRAGFYCFQKICGGVLFCEICALFLLRFCLVKSKTCPKYP